MEYSEYVYDYVDSWFDYGECNEDDYDYVDFWFDYGESNKRSTE